MALGGEIRLTIQPWQQLQRPLERFCDFVPKQCMVRCSLMKQSQLK
jgi:hypothetical protein